MHKDPFIWSCPFCIADANVLGWNSHRTPTLRLTPLRRGGDLRYQVEGLPCLYVARISSNSAELKGLGRDTRKSHPESDPSPEPNPNPNPSPNLGPS